MATLRVRFLAEEEEAETKQKEESLTVVVLDNKIFLRIVSSALGSLLKWTMFLSREFLMGPWSSSCKARHKSFGSLDQVPSLLPQQTFLPSPVEESLCLLLQGWPWLAYTVQKYRAVKH